MASLLRLPDFSRKPSLGFIKRRSGPFEGTVTLDRSRVYILPTRSGVIFGLLLILLLLGSVNYGKSLGYVLVFLMAGVGNVAIFSTWRNLAGLRLRAGGCAPVFCGEHAEFVVQLESLDPVTRYSIAIACDGVEHEVIDVPANSVTQAHFRRRTKQRGLIDAGRFRLSTEFPTGLFVAWTWIELSMQCVVYPKPAQVAAMASSETVTDGEADSHGEGLEEFAGLRKYQSGDSWRQVSWKATARSGELHTKEFAGGEPDLQWIDWKAIAASGVESRLSIMTRLVMDAESAQRYYGLKMPTMDISPDHGNVHYQQCLKTLALYGKS